MSLFLDDPVTMETCDPCKSVDGAHGRMETRRALLCHDVAWLNARHDWPSLKAIGNVIATRRKDGTTTTQTRYYLLSTLLSAKRFLAVKCAHWAIEHSLHWVLDAGVRGLPLVMFMEASIIGILWLNQVNVCRCTGGYSMHFRGGSVRGN